MNERSQTVGKTLLSSFVSVAQTVCYKVGKGTQVVYTSVTGNVVSPARRSNKSLPQRQSYVRHFASCPAAVSVRGITVNRPEAGRGGIREYWYFRAVPATVYENFERSTAGGECRTSANVAA